jgi:hypothetical protein
MITGENTRDRVTFYCDVCAMFDFARYKDATQF